MAEKEIKQHGFFGKIIKIVMVIVFMLIGAALITLGAIYRAKKWDIGTYEGQAYNIKWLSILNIVLGCLLLTSPFFLNQRRSGLNKVIQIIMIVVFVLIGVLLIVSNSIILAKHQYEPQYKWFPIVNLVFGCLLFTAPVFLKKD